MSVTLIPILLGLFYGTGNNLPKLPRGFTAIEVPDYFVTAKGPDGREWYVTEMRLVLKGRLPDGKPCFDERETISL